MAFDDLQTMNAVDTAPLIHIGPPAGDTTRRGDMDIFRARISDDGALTVLDHWHNLVIEHGLRIKNRIDPLAYAPLLEHIYMEEWDPIRKESKIRLQGDAIRSLWGGNVVGQRVSDQVSGETEAVWRQSDDCCFLQGRPTLCYYNLAHRGRDYYWVWDLVLPMRDDKDQAFALGYVWRDSEKS